MPPRLDVIDRTACPLCGHHTGHELVRVPFDAPDLHSFLLSYYGGRLPRELVAAGDYVVNRCAACGGMWQRYILDAEGMRHLYDEWIDEAGSRQKRRDPGRALDHARQCGRLVQLLPDPESRLVMDYGMGWADWCLMARAFGFRVHGVEISPARLNWARSQGIECSPPEAMPKGPFDFIRLEQVLEHVPEPRAMMDNLVSRVRPGGVVLVGVPDGRPVPGRARTPGALFRKGPAQPLEHINIFTPASLGTFMGDLGCQPVVERESLIRVSSLRLASRDGVAALARVAAPALLTLRTTRSLFRRVS